jgi:hypothetical protein
MSIKTMVSSSNHLDVQVTTTPYISSYSGTQSAGMVRFNTNSSSLEVYDGNSWLNIETHATVSLRNDSELALGWALKQMRRMEELERLAQTKPAIADALANLRKAEEQLRIVEILCKEEDND